MEAKIDPQRAHLTKHASRFGDTKNRIWLDMETWASDSSVRQRGRAISSCGVDLNVVALVSSMDPETIRNLAMVLKKRGMSPQFELF